MKSRNPLEKIAASAHKNRCELRLSVCCCEGEAMAERFAHAACVDFFGRVSRNWLCPSHPDVRTYLGALVEDITTHYPVAVVELESAGVGANHKHRSFNQAFMASNDPRAIPMAWCVCTACAQRATDAGIDMRELREILNSFFEQSASLQPPNTPLIMKLIDDDPVLAAYEEMRTETVSTLIRSLRARSRAPVNLELCLHAHRAGEMQPNLAIDCDGYFISKAPMNDDSSIAHLLQAVGGPSRCGVGFASFPPHTESGPSLVTAVHRASQAGHPWITFQNYGGTPEPCLDWVRQAIRYARREAT